MTNPSQTLKATGTTAAVAATDVSERARRSMTDEATRLIAAITLARADFPTENNLPRLAPVPHNQLGHLVLLDYDRVAMILWGTAREIQYAVKENPNFRIAPAAAILVTLVLLVLAGMLISQNSDSPVGLPLPRGAFSNFSAWDTRGGHRCLLLLPMGLIAGIVTYLVLRPNTARIAADIRARNMRLLLDGKEPPSAEQFRESLASRRANGELVEWAGAELEGGRCPVLVMNNEQFPFRGFGYRQANQLFVCRPEDESKAPGLSLEALDQAVSEALTQMVKNSGIPCVSSGHVVLIDGRTLRKGSPWLRPGARDNTSATPPTG